MNSTVLMLVFLAVTTLGNTFALRQALGNDSSAQSASTSEDEYAVVKMLQSYGMLDSSGKFIHAFVQSVALILVSELGDKTFIIAAIMAMKHSRLEIFSAALGALAAMTVLSSAMGWAAPQLISKVWTHWGAVGLFAFFGFKLLKDAWGMSPSEGPSEELMEVESELKEKEDEEGSDDDEEGGGPKKRQDATLWDRFFPKVFIQCFTLTFLAEWGDRSQIATIALAAKEDPIGVTLGGIIGHAFCTGLAVIGGRLLAARISEKTVSYVGGVLFVIFAVGGVYEGLHMTK